MLSIFTVLAIAAAPAGMRDFYDPHVNDQKCEVRAVLGCCFLNSQSNPPTFSDLNLVAQLESLEKNRKPALSFLSSLPPNGQENKSGEGLYKAFFERAHDAASIFGSPLDGTLKDFVAELYLPTLQSHLGSALAILQDPYISDFPELKQKMEHIKTWMQGGVRSLSVSSQQSLISLGKLPKYLREQPEISKAEQELKKVADYKLRLGRDLLQHLNVPMVLVFRKRGDIVYNATTKTSSFNNGDPILIFFGCKIVNAPNICLKDNKNKDCFAAVLEMYSKDDLHFDTVKADIFSSGVVNVLPSTILKFFQDVFTNNFQTANYSLDQFEAHWTINNFRGNSGILIDNYRKTHPTQVKDIEW